MLIVQRYYLRVYKGGFTENFYGLKRESVLRVKDGEVPRAQLGAAGLIREALELRESDIWRNLAFMVGLPYVKRKLDESYDIHVPQASLLGPGFQRDSLPAAATLRQRLMHYYKWFLRNVYPSVNAGYYFSLLAFNLAYLFDNSKYDSPFMWLIGTRLRRLGEADYRAIATAMESSSQSKKASRPGQTRSLFSPRLFGRVIYPNLLSSIKVLLPVSIFALKFLEWWHASDFARQLSRKATEGLELPPPLIQQPSNGSAKHSSPQSSKEDQTLAERRSNVPERPPISSISSLPIFTVPLPSPEESHLCPICRQSITTPTASPSGYVFCYSCIHKWVEGIHEKQTEFTDGVTEGKNFDKTATASGRRSGKWESGKGRCAVSGHRILGATEGLRRVMV